MTMHTNLNSQNKDIYIILKWAFAILSMVMLSPVRAQTSEKINISFFGLSVCNGSNADNKQGFAWQFYHSNTIDRTNYQYFNVSTGGDK